MREAFVELRGVTKSFAGTLALNGVELVVSADELLVVLGPTGAGKTTLLRCLAGLELPDRGVIELGGRDVTHAPPAERDVALVFQNFSLYPDWSVRKNLEFPLRAPGRRVAPDEIARRVAWASKLLKIERLLERRASKLSGGEMQRVAIGRAIVRRPRLFLMDEPLTNLDAKLREALRTEIIALRRELAIPMVYVTHDQAEALSMGDRVLVLGDGRVLQEGAPREVYERPCSPLVARQLGQPAINLFEVTQRDGSWVSANGIALAAEGAPVELPRAGDRTVLGVRPEHVILEGGVAPAKVLVVEDMGPTKTVYFDWGERVRAVVEKPNTAKAGDVIYPKIVEAQALLWPALD